MSHKVRELCFFLATVATAASCQGEPRVEQGGILVALVNPPGAPLPSELRLSVYDDTGVLFRDERMPRQGTLLPTKPPALGTVLLQPGPTSGTVRIFVRGFAIDKLTSEALLKIAPEQRSHGAFDFKLSTQHLPDADDDGVPDQIDDCPAHYNPDQQGCPSATDGGTDGPRAPTRDAHAPADTDRRPAPDLRPPPPPPKRLGQACGAARECASGFCKDGVCCGSACDTPCFTCGTGTCTAVTRTDDAPECTGTMSCNPQGKCRGWD